MSVIRQHNKLTSARYELSKIEKRILYFFISEIQKRYDTKTPIDKTIFEDLIINTTSKKLLEGIPNTHPNLLKKAIQSLRQRSLHYQDDDLWIEVGFINYAQWNRGGFLEFEMSRKILPFFFELSSKYTEYQLMVAISLKSKWSQRFYELSSRWRNAGGTTIKIDDLREMFNLKTKYSKYALFKANVIDVAHKELKELYLKNECDVYFEYSELKEGRAVDAIRLKIISKDKNTEVAKDTDIIYLVREQLYSIFEVDKKPKNKDKIQKLMSKLILENPKDLTYVYGKIQYTKEKKPRQEWQKYLRAIFNSEYDFQNL